MAKKIDDAVLDELLKGCERPEDLMTDGGLMMEPRRALMPFDLLIKGGTLPSGTTADIGITGTDYWN